MTSKHDAHALAAALIEATEIKEEEATNIDDRMAEAFENRTAELLTRRNGDLWHTRQLLIDALGVVPKPTPLPDCFDKFSINLTRIGINMWETNCQQWQSTFYEKN